MKTVSKILYILIILFLVICIPQNTFARANNEIEVYKMGDSSITLKWTPYTVEGTTVNKYTIGYRVHGDIPFNSIDVNGTSGSPDFSNINNEFTKKITGLNLGTIYDFKLDIYLQGNPVPVTYYNNITTMTKIVLDKTQETFLNPYNNDDVAHIDFAFAAPNESVGGVLSSVNQNNIEGYSIAVSSLQGEVYSSGQPYKVLYNSISSKYEIFRVLGTDSSLTYNGTQFQFSPQVKLGNDFLAFSLYKTNQPSQDNFNFATNYYVVIKPIFKAGSGYQNIIVNATENYETIETISTLLPLTVSQIENDLVRLQFPQVGTGSMSYEVYRGRLSSDLSKIHTEYNDGSRSIIQYYNKISDPLEGDVYYFQVGVSGSDIKSKVIPITISLTPNIAPVVDNIQIETVLVDELNNSADIIISWDKPQEEDVHKDNLIYRVYINTDRVNQVNDIDVIYDGDGNVALDSNGNILLNTKKDINNNNILFNGFPVVYERIVEIYPSDLAGSDDPYNGENPIDNFITDETNNYYTILRDDIQVTRTLYRIHGADFLSNSDVPTISGEPHTVYESILEGELGTDYKNKFDLNTTYFLKMSTFNTSISEKSDFSLISSFTTPQSTVDEVPIPQNFGVYTLDTNKIGLVWNKLNDTIYEDSMVNYELFMSDNGGYEDEDFTRVIDGVLTTVDDTKHLLIDSQYTLQGGASTQVEPNKVYLFKVRAVWETEDSMGNTINVYSSFSNIVPVTTKRSEIPDPEINTPLTPIDFVLTSVSTKSASFQWTAVDDISTYRIVKTSVPIDQFAPLTETGDGVANGFTQSEEIYSYSATELTANTLYYFSIRSETIVGGQTIFSSWVTIPVTTILVEQPTELSLVSKTEKGHSLTISWKGKASLDYEIVYRTDEAESFVLYKTISGAIGNDSSKTFESTITGLNSNTLYYIKVRAKDSASGMFSKYTEAILARTEFNQDDYDDETENSEKNELVSDIKNDWLNVVINNISTNTDNTVLWIKPEKASDTVKNSPNSTYKIDIRDNLVKNSNIYLPMDLIEALNSKKENLEIKVPQGSIYFRPGILDTETLSSKLDDEDIEIKVVKLQINQLPDTEASKIVPKNEYIASKAYEINIKMVGYDETVDDLDEQISKEIDELISVQDEITPYRTTDQIRESLYKDLQKTVRRVIDDAYVSEVYASIDSDKKIRVDFSYNQDKSGNSNRYVPYLKIGQTLKEVQGQIVGGNRIQFELDNIGKIVIAGKKGPRDISGHPSKGDIEYLLSQYDYQDEVVNGNFRPNAIATVNTAAKFIVNVLSPSEQKENSNYIKRAQELGILKGSGIWEYNRSITKEQLAYLMAKVYELNTGISADKMDVGNDILLNDEEQINDAFKSSVYLMLKLKIMKNSAYNVFNPSQVITRGELCTALANTIRKSNEMD